MRRSLPALAMTAAGVITLLRFQSSPGGAIRVGTTSGTTSGTTPGTTPSTSPGTAPGTSPSTSPRPATVADGTYDGAEVQTRYGPVKVQVTVAGGAVTDVRELETPSDRQRSLDINAQAGPILRSEALQAQSAQLDQVSGATITWGAYEQSLQAALDAAHR